MRVPHAKMNVVHVYIFKKVIHYFKIVLFPEIFKLIFR